MLVVWMLSLVVFQNVFDVAVVYHFIRGQSLLKLYVAFNMLEIVERMWRSLERDVFDDLRITIENWENIWRMFQRTSLAVACVVIHTVMHLLRGLLLCIAFTSDDSGMFLLMVTNNFSEVKSTVFKKQNPATLWAVASADIVERFQFLMDGVFVYLQTSRSPTLKVQETTSASRWLALMVCIEILVDFSKHAFLVKFNNLKANLFNQFHSLLLMDYLYARHPKIIGVIAPKVTIRNPTPSQAYYSFPAVSTKRLGLSTLPFLIFVQSSIPFRLMLSESWLTGLITMFLVWLNLALGLVSIHNRFRSID